MICNVWGVKGKDCVYEWMSEWGCVWERKCVSRSICVLVLLIWISLYMLYVCWCGMVYVLGLWLCGLFYVLGMCLCGLVYVLGLCLCGFVYVLGWVFLFY